MQTLASPGPSPSSTRLFWLLQLGGWTAYAVALMVPWLGRYPISAMWSNKLVIAGTGLVTSSTLRLLYRRASRDGLGFGAVGGLAVVAAAVGAFVWNATASAILGRSLQHDSILLGALGRTMPRFDGVLYHTLVLLTWSLLYLGARHYRALVAERERSYRAESLAREARLLALRYQIGPHFFFNALNAISTLVVTDRKAEATATIARLAELLRASLEAPSDGMIPLARELEIVRCYLAIEQIRFADRLSVDVDADPRSLDILVPALILQPLVENAVRHGVASRDEPTRVAIRTVLGDDTLTLSVADDGTGTNVSSNGFGVGLTNVRARLDEAYGTGHRFVAGATTGGGFRAELVIPRDGAVQIAPTGESQPAWAPVLVQ
ncbi:MAG TPA: histidine kinase, partial [Gemmatimonadaceae bacterium]|nr:histidine kinase [Gemmatimonadaceae bacterium]